MSILPQTDKQETIHLPSLVDLSKEVLFQQMKGESILLDLSSEQYIGLDSIGTRIWELYTENGSSEHVVAQMLQEYEVEEVKLRLDLAKFVGNLIRLGLAQESLGR